MARFHKLKNNESEFPHIDNVNVYKYDNDFNYGRYDYDQMDLIICNVPWNTGVVHVGQAQITGIGNVVAFGNKASRDKWFNDIPDNECYRFSTKFKELHRDLQIDVPVPYDVCARYNYLVVHYHKFANDDSLVQYEGEPSIDDWFWFIREVEFLAPNTTRLHLIADAFQTFIYDIDVTGMILERGHAPMFATKADSYLANPVTRSANLLAPDVNYGNADIAKHTEEVLFNADNVVAVIVTTANPVNGNWGSKSNDNWATSADRHFRVQGVPSYCAFAVNVADLFSLFTAIDSQCPQFAQTIKAICFVSSDYLSYTMSFNFCGISCKTVSAGYVENNLYSFNKSDFAYPDKYADIAKLYTYPYAKLVIADENGSASEIRIENCTGNIKLETKIGLVWPWLNVTGHVRGIGRAGNRNITFHNVTAQTFPIGGNWWEYAYEWNIPTFGITLNAATDNDYATHFDRLQTATAGTNAYNNEIESANASLGDSNATAGNTIANATLQTALNNANNTAGITKSVADRDNAQQQAAGSTVAASVFSGDTTNNQVDYKYATGVISAASSGINGAVSGGTTMAAGGPVGAAVGAVAGGAVGAISSMLTTQAGVNLDLAQLAATYNYSSNQLAVTNLAASNAQSASEAESNARTTAANNYTTASANNGAALIRGNATRDYNAASANASRNLSTVNASISNQIAQAALNAPAEYGDFSSGDTAVSRPMGLFAHIVTQSDYAIQSAGDEFLRYGYAFDKQWEFNGNWNVGKYFTYWKLRDFWIRNVSIPDAYVDQIRFFLLGGVTIWRSPEYIGHVDVYENFN